MVEAKKASSKMQKTITGISMELFTGEAHNEWMKYSNEMQNHLKQISYFQNIDKIRTTFQHISAATIVLTS